MKLPLVTAFVPQILIVLVLGVVSIVIFTNMHDTAITNTMRSSLDGSMIYVEERVAGPFERLRSDARLLALSARHHNGEVYQGEGLPLNPPTATPASLTVLQPHLQDMRAMIANSNGEYAYVYQQYRMRRLPTADPAGTDPKGYFFGWTGAAPSYLFHHVNMTLAGYFCETDAYPNFTTSDLYALDDAGADTEGTEFVENARYLTRANASEGAYVSLVGWTDTTGYAPGDLVPLNVIFTFTYPISYDAAGYYASMINIDINAGKWLADYIGSLTIPATYTTIIEPERNKILATDFPSLQPGYARPNLTDDSTWTLWTPSATVEPRLTDAMRRIDQLGFPLASIPHRTFTMEDQGNGDIVSVRPLRLAGLNLVIVGVTYRSHFFESGETVQTNAIVVCAVLVLLAVGIGVATAILLTRPMSDMAHRMHQTASLMDDDSVIVSSWFTELAMMQDAYVEMKVQLVAVRCYLPQGLLQTGGGKDNPIKTPRTDDTPITNTSMTSMVDIMESEANKAVELGQLHQEVNVLTTRDAVVLIVSVAYDCDLCDPRAAAIIGEVFERVCSAAVVTRGVIESATPQQIVVTFGLRSAVGNTAGHALRMAKLVTKARDLPEVELSVLLDRGALFSGTCGTGNFRQQTFYSPEMGALKHLAVSLHSHYRLPVVSTSRFAASLGTSVTSLPFESIHLRGEDIHLFAILPVKPTGFSNSAAKALSGLKAAFAEQSSGDAGAMKDGLDAVELPKSDGQQVEKDDDVLVLVFLTRIKAILAASCASMAKNTRAASRRFIGWELSDEGKPTTTLAPLFDPARMVYGGRAAQQLKMLHRLENDQRAPLLCFGVEDEDHGLGSFIEPDEPPSNISISMQTTTLGAWKRSEATIGRGAFGQVFRALHKNGSLAAMKILPMQSRKCTIDELRKELTIMSQQRHENLVGYVDSSVDEGELVLVTELLAGGSLDALVRDFGALELPVIRRFTIDILRGLSHLHRGGIVHCDIKPQNILVGVEGMCKLADFGSALHGHAASPVAGDEMLKIDGTPAYLAPEVAAGKLPTTASDIWSIGVVVHELVTGTHPFNDNQRAVLRTGGSVNVIRMLGRIRPDCTDPTALEAPLVPRVSGVPDERAVYDFIKSCLEFDPAKRPTADGLMLKEFLL